MLAYLCESFQKHHIMYFVLIRGIICYALQICYKETLKYYHKFSAHLFFQSES
uniref:Uncharacterized protein n=2 Tax=Anguilla anguilla TaxID=7936 RepID=A0A0E9RID5_ANGAN